MSIFKTLFPNKHDQQIAQAKAELTASEKETFLKLGLKGLEHTLNTMGQAQSKSVLNSFKSLLKLDVSGEHKLYINNVFYKVVFNNGALVSIDEIKFN